MPTDKFDITELKRRMHGATQSLKQIGRFSEPASRGHRCFSRCRAMPTALTAG